MGLLDDAIREHLELKRLRGADPGEVAREQREALDPDAHATADDDAAAAREANAAGEAVSANASGETAVGVTPAADVLPSASELARSEDFADVVPETAELDMRSVLDEDHGAPVADVSPGGPVVAGPAAGASAGEPAEEDSLEWEVPGDAAEPAADAAHDENAVPEDLAEDVLEETPDFLRDTPEQERLWFEQRPPRDFDFDK
jgi:hypothetical protein